ncbi:hypothetical protein HYU22_05800 [Candidatus Woesearchaeota archaeon]|nr:hypothetical protein [Candidatus Woesearchaeota archaeon]
MLNKLGQLLGISAYLVNGERKKEINAIVETIKEKYSIPPVTETTLENIAEEYGIGIFRSDLALITPISLNSYRQIILPRYLHTGNMAHEIGHIVLNTRMESEADYFMKEITGRPAIIDNYHGIKEHFSYYMNVVARIRDHPYHLVDQATLLKRQGANVEGINFLIGDIKIRDSKLLPECFDELSA